MKAALTGVDDDLGFFLLLHFCGFFGGGAHREHGLVMFVLVIRLVGLVGGLHAAIVLAFTKNWDGLGRRNQKFVRTVGVCTGFPALGQGEQLHFFVAFGLDHPREKLQDFWLGGRVDPALDLGSSGMGHLENKAQLSRVARIARTQILDVFMKLKSHWIARQLVVSLMPEPVRCRLASWVAAQ